MAKQTALTLAVVIAAFFLIAPRVARAQDATPRITRTPVNDDFQPITDEDIQMMRKDIRSQRKQIIAANMDLSDQEAEQFWPLYERYTQELVAKQDGKYLGR